MEIKLKIKKRKSTDKQMNAYECAVEIVYSGQVGVGFEYALSGELSVSAILSRWTGKWTPQNNTKSISFASKLWSAEIDNKGSFTLTRSLVEKDFQPLFPVASNIFKMVKNTSFACDLEMHI